jgi:hypothetical protein
MALKKKRRRKKIKENKPMIHKILGLFILIVALTVGIYSFTSNNTSVSRIAEEDNLQLKTFNPFSSPEKPEKPKNNDNPNKEPEEACINTDNGLAESKPICNCAAYLFRCENRKCAEVNNENSALYKILGPINCNVVDNQQWCELPGGGGRDGWYCVAKPVIYLYPEKPTLVEVRVKTAGEIFVSDPQIETFGGSAPNETNGWNNVLAYPNGKLVYEGKEYRELFYESNVEDIKRPEKGLMLNSENIRVELDKVISKLGLINEEKVEFMDFWIPRLENLKSKYVFFGIIDQDEKDRIDNVYINPKPDTFIEFIAYFAPLEKPYDGKKLELPSAPPARTGFTAVEWGGTVGK